MTARHKAGQERFDQEIHQLISLAGEAESTGNFGLAVRYYRHALELIELSGAASDLRSAVENALLSAQARA